MARSIIVVGSGGREHAIVVALSQSLGAMDTIFVAPGNAGIAASTLTPKVTAVALNKSDELVAFARANGVSLAVVGPEVPLAEGIADAFGVAGVPCFGPNQACARLESSKAFAKSFMQRHNIATARYAAFTAFADAESFIRSCGYPVVVKASGLAAGKGVFVPESVDEAVAAARSVLVERLFGEAGAELVVEERLAGPEASVIGFTDGETVIALPAAQDHKRAFEFSAGGNTGGMGAVAPAPGVPPALLRRIESEVLQRAVDGLRSEGLKYVGALFAGIMLTQAGPVVLEFNCRLGDPETQVILPLLERGSVLPLMERCVAGGLGRGDVRVRPGVVAANVVAVAAGYPDTPRKGDTITFSGAVEAAAAGACIFNGGSTFLFHAGVAGAAGGAAVLSTAGGRVISATAIAPSRTAALQQAYSALDGVSFAGMRLRRDIGGGFYRPRSATEPLRVGVLGSTRGSSLAPVLAAITAGELCGVRVEVVVSNVEGAGILEKATAAGVPAVVVTSKGKSREAFDREVASVLQGARVDVVLCIGFMRIVTSTLLDQFRWRILNVHPSLLPAFAGGMDLAVHQAVLDARVPVTGCTVHFVEDAVDAGAILLQKSCAVLPGDTAEALKARVQALEGAALIEALSLFADDAEVPLLATIRREGWPAAAAKLPADRIAAAAPPSVLGGALTYAAAGVDIDAGDALVERIKPLAKSTARPGADAELGGFGGLFDLKACGFRDPVLVSSTDGVGTKLRVAQLSGVHTSIGIDLVAMSVNDLIVQGAEPLLFLDYYACGKLQVAAAADVIAGIAEGCRQAGCALVGGETAEMPSMYHGDDYDLAGFAVGAVERERVLPALGAQVPGDVLIGLVSSGLHSNGYSLARKVVAQYGLDWHAPPPFPSEHKRLCDALLTPTRIYMRALAPVLPRSGPQLLKGLAHITGGGLPGNVNRTLAPGLQADIDCSTWAIPPVFKWLARAGAGVAPDECARAFNLGIGMVIVVGADVKDEVLRLLRTTGEAPVVLGALRQKSAPSDDDVVLHGLGAALLGP